MKKIKILYTIPNFDTAGSGKVLYDLAKGLDKDTFEVFIACSNNKGAFFEEVEKLGLPIFIIPITKPLKPYYSLLFRLRDNIKFIKNHKIDIVHSWHWSSDWTEVLAARLGGAKFVYTKKAMTWGNIHWKIKSFLSNYIITTNPEMKNYFKYKKNQQLIPFGIDESFFNPNLFNDTTTIDKFKIITVANLVAVKSIETSIEAIHYLQNPKIQFDIIGDDTTPYATSLKQLVKHYNLENQIFFLGKQTDIRPFLMAADLYIISSKKEGLPVALLEAMAMKKLILATQIPGIQMVMQGFEEYLFEVENHKELSEKINKILNLSKEQKNNIAQQLYTYSITNFSIKNCLIKHQNLYLKLALHE